ncbi:hypothetical protein MTQ00_04305 [Chryseobacterium sp. B21-037]|uniref:hypothetical protein n=1 Tax=unclassified Chryseobacterium TaxID=2593645 RepID=UPI002358AAB8|nr:MULTISPECIES: hypothetical protein [unclassified Chryseobacterium]MDC8103754.1 hypothetical protein [Chryseobacterium sp. B21-037]MDQ1803362.1 hypothetical protein [Chryseobacterium sp. CKR4-1]
MKYLYLVVCSLLIIACKGQGKTDLSTLRLNESIEDLIDFKNKNMVEVNTVEYPFCLFIEIDNSEKFTFDGIDLKGQKVFFQINSERLKTDSITKFGGGHFDMQGFKDKKELAAILKKQKADPTIYGFRIEMKTPALKKEILKKLESRYGKGIKNPNTDNGLYWNVKKDNRYIFYAPDYDRLIILNNTNLSKTCYWDAMNGLIDFGGCDNESYTKELTKNRTDSKDIKDKPVIKIDKSWNINGLALGTSTEADFVKSSLNKNFERITTVDSKGDLKELMQQNTYNNFHFYFTAGKNGENDQKNNILKGYAINDFEAVEVSFGNQLKKGMKGEDVLKIIGKNDVVGDPGLKYSNYLEIKNPAYKINLIFDDNKLFSSMYVLKKE